MALNKAVYRRMSNEFFFLKILFLIKGHWVKHQ